jgi:cytochrome P450
MVPQDGTYLPWSYGPQNCPGKRFAQVEVVTVLACLLHKHSITVVCDEGESDQMAQKRIQNVCNDSKVGLLLHMKYPDDPWLNLKKVL